MNKFTKVLIAALALVSLAASATEIGVPVVPEQEGSNAEAKASGGIAVAFARLHHAAMAEIEAGRLASQKAKSREVRAFGERIVRDHQINDRRLMTFAAENAVPVDRAPAISAEQASREGAALATLVAADPDGFDRIFLSQMSAAHAVILQELAAAVVRNEDAPARKLVAKIHAIIQQHQKLGAILLEKTS